MGESLVEPCSDGILLHDSGKLHSVVPSSNQDNLCVTKTSVPSTGTDKVSGSSKTDNASKKTHTGSASSPLASSKTVTLPTGKDIKETDGKAQNPIQKGRENVVLLNKLESVQVNEHDQEDKNELAFIEELAKFEKDLITRTENISGQPMVFLVNKIPKECLEKINSKNFKLKKFFPEERLENFSDILEKVSSSALTMEREITQDEFRLCIKKATTQFNHIRDFGDFITYCVNETRLISSSAKDHPEQEDGYYVYENIKNRNRGKAFIRLRNAFEIYKSELVLRARHIKKVGFLELLKKIYIERKENEARRKSCTWLEREKVSRKGFLESDTAVPISDAMPIEGKTFPPDLQPTKSSRSDIRMRHEEMEKNSYVRHDMVALNENPMN